MGVTGTKVMYKFGESRLNSGRTLTNVCNLSFEALDTSVYKRIMSKLGA